MISSHMEMMNSCVGVFPRGVTPTSKFVCVLPFPNGDARRHRDLSWFGQEKALRPAGEESLYYLAPKFLYISVHMSFSSVLENLMIRNSLEKWTKLSI